MFSSSSTVFLCIQNILSENLSSEELEKIDKPIKILGSASIKVVVLIRLKDGSEVVCLIRRPNAIEQVYSNMKLVKNYILAFSKRIASSEVDYNIPSGAINLLVRDLELQIFQFWPHYSPFF